jgi:hypothetical protein
MSVLEDLYDTSLSKRKGISEEAVRRQFVISVAVNPTKPRQNP